MKRDMDLIRKILLKIEESKQSYAESDSIKTLMGDSDNQSLYFHMHLLNQAGYISNITLHHFIDGSREFAGIVELTWNGYEFLDAARNDTIWKKLKDKMKSTGTELPFTIITQVLNYYIKDLFLPDNHS